MSLSTVVTGDVTYELNAGQRPSTITPQGRLRVDSTSTPLPAGTDRSGSIATGGTAQQLAPANSSRQSLTGQNISSGDLWINEIGGTAAVNGTGSYKIVSGAAFSVATNRAISIIGAASGQQFTATEV